MGGCALRRVSNNSELQGAPNSAKKRTKKRTIYFPPKRAIFLIKGAHFFTLVPSFLTPSTIFIAFLCMNFLECPILQKKISIFLVIYINYP